MKIEKLIELTPAQSLKAVRDFSQEFYHGLDTPVALSCSLLLKYGEYEQLCRKEIKPDNYLNAWTFQNDYAAVSLLKKYDGFELKLDLEKEALEKFMWAESQCLKHNTGFRNVRDVVLGKDSSFTYSSVLYEAGKICQKILGPLPDPGSLRYEFGPGASSSCKGRNVSLSDKLISPIIVTRLAAGLVSSHYSNEPWRVASALGFWPDNKFSYTSDAVSILDYNTLGFVPKSSTSLRAICIEPNDMTYLQKGYGNFIRNRLRLSGLDLSNQQRINGEFARIGSLNGSFSTIDLKSASDTISCAFAYEVLPLDWFERLFRLTCRYTKLPSGEIIRNEKFSSMGNGFTFELETLLFYCIAKAVRRLHGSKSHVQVYGDDIIVPSEISDDVLSALNLSGFTANQEKTFVTGPFRESCGQDWFLGTNVLPHFLKRKLTSVFDIYSLANGVRRLARKFHSDDICDSRFYRSWVFLTRLVPSHLRLYGPSYLGDQIFEVNRAYSQGTRNYRTHIPICSPVPDRGTLERFPDFAQLGSLLLGTSPSFPLRGRPRRYRVVVDRVSSSFWSWNDGVWSHLT